MRVVDDLKDENEQYRKMVMETIEQILTNMGATDIDNRLEEQLIDGILYAFQVSYVRLGCYGMCQVGLIETRSSWFS